MLALRTLPATAAAGAAADLLLCHGFLGAGRNLTALGQALAARLPDTAVHLVDLPGHGFSPPLSGNADLADMARAVWSSLPAPNGPLRLVGHSLGGRVALAMAQMKAAAAAEAEAAGARRLAEVVLLDISASPLSQRKGEMENIFSLVLAADARAARREVFRDRFVEQGMSPPLAEWVTTNLQRDGDAFVWRIDRQALDGFQRRQRRCDLWPTVESLGSRCRLLFGGRSDFVPPADRLRFRAHGASVEEVARAGHFIHVDALPEVVDFVCRERPA